MSVCCIGGVCIPYSAIFPLLLLALKWVAQHLTRMGLLPDALAQRLKTTNEPSNDNALKEAGCCACTDGAKSSTSDASAATKLSTMSDSSVSSADGVITVESVEAWSALLKSNDYVVCKFTATWCVPCKKIAPVYEALAQECTSARNKSVRFVQIDVDDLDDVAAQYNVAMMPTFMVFCEQQPVGTLRGSSEQKLRDFVKHHLVS